MTVMLPNEASTEDGALPSEEWLSPRDICILLHIPEQSFYQWRVKHEGPRTHKAGRHLRIYRSDFDAWLSQHLEA